MASQSPTFSDIKSLHLVSRGELPDDMGGVLVRIGRSRTESWVVHRQQDVEFLEELLQCRRSNDCPDQQPSLAATGSWARSPSRFFRAPPLLDLT